MFKKRNIAYFFAAIIIFFLFLAARVPAGLALGYIGKKTRIVTAYQPSGTLWHGAASDVTIRYGNSSLSLGPTEWNVGVLPLLVGKLSVDLEAVKNNQKITGNFSLGSGPSLGIDNAEIVVDAGTLTKLYPARIPGEVQGVVELTLKEFEYDGGVVDELEGSLVVKDSVYTLGSPFVLGSYAAKLSVKDKLVTANVSDIDATVAVDGVATFSPETKQYTANITLRPKTDANPVIAQALSAFTKSQPDGSYQFVR